MKKFSIIGLAMLAFVLLSAVHAEIKVVPLPGNPHFNYKATINWYDITNQSGTNITVQIFPGGSGTLSAGATVMNAAFVLTTPFDGATNISSLTITVGDDGDIDRYIVSKEIAVDSTEILYWANAAANQAAPYSYATNGNAIDANLILGAPGVGPAFSQLTTGQIYILLQIVDLDIWRND